MKEPKFKINQLVAFTDEFRLHDQFRGSLEVKRYIDVTGKIHGIGYNPDSGTSGSSGYTYSIRITGSAVSVSKDERYISAAEEELNPLEKL